MTKISTKASTILSLILSAMFFVAIIFGAFIMPGFVRIIMGWVKPAILILGYLVLFVALIADILMFFLLIRVKNELVFTGKSVSIIRAVSYCAFVIGILFIALGYFFKIAFVVSVAAIFLGLCLRVVKNVIEKACEIKEENDLTV